MTVTATDEAENGPRMPQERPAAVARPFDPSDAQIAEAALYAAVRDDLEEDVARLAVELGEMHRERDAARAEVSRLKSEVDRLVADRLGAYAAEVARVEAERDALVGACLRESPRDGGCLVDCAAHVGWYDSKAEAVAALFKAAGPGAAGEEG